MLACARQPNCILPRAILTCACIPAPPVWAWQDVITRVDATLLNLGKLPYLVSRAER
jgi:hypothetical protein